MVLWRYRNHNGSQENKQKNGGSTSTHAQTHTRSDLFIPTAPNYHKARTSHQHRRAYAAISWMRCDFYDGGVKAVTLPASSIQPACKCVCTCACARICRRRCQSVCERDGGGDDRRWHHLPNISSCRFINGVKEKSKAEAQSSSKRQQNANITVKAVKYNVRAFPKAAGTIKREFKGVR